MSMGKYQRQARHAAELGLQWFTRLDQALVSGHEARPRNEEEGQERAELVSENALIEGVFMGNDPHVNSAAHWKCMPSLT